MDTIATIGQLISTYGFPIVACGALYWFIIKELREDRKIIENNTQALIKILEHIKKEDDK